MIKNYEEHETPVVIRYNWEILKKYTNNDVHLILEFFDSVYIRKTENYFYLTPWAAKVVAESANNSPNYIQNAEALMKASKGATDSELFVYIDLASRRSYFTFVNTKQEVNYLPIWKVLGEYDVNALKMNRLLTIDDNNIILLYEIGE